MRAYFTERDLAVFEVFPCPVPYRTPNTLFHLFAYILNVYLPVEAINLNMFMLNLISITFEKNKHDAYVRNEQE